MLTWEKPAVQRVLLHPSGELSHFEARQAPRNVGWTADIRPFGPWKSWQPRGARPARHLLSRATAEPYAALTVDASCGSEIEPPSPPNDPRIPGPGVALGVGAYLAVPSARSSNGFARHAGGCHPGGQ
jgi:hypothetical protein